LSAGASKNYQIPSLKSIPGRESQRGKEEIIFYEEEKKYKKISRQDRRGNTLAVIECVKP